ncbi:pentapeptide repeat-containing protein [Flavobacterium sp. N1718]|nr:pentapeptide repeat-containing protein [Flavobacterium sp. N1718]
MSDKLIFEVHFTDCILDFAKFYGLRMNAATFTRCSLVAVDFMACDLQNVVFDQCDLYRAEFEKADARRCDFSSSRNYTLHPGRTKVQRALFSRNGLAGLVSGFGVQVVE